MLDATKEHWKQLLHQLESYIDRVQIRDPEAAALGREISTELGRSLGALMVILLLSAMGVLAVWWGM